MIYTWQNERRWEGGEVLWRSASEPWHRAWRLILREDGVHWHGARGGPGNRAGASGARVARPGRHSPRCHLTYCFSPCWGTGGGCGGAGATRCQGAGAAGESGAPVLRSTSCTRAAWPQVSERGSGKCKGRGSISQCPQVRSHLPQHWGTGSVAAVRGVGMDIQQHCAGELSRGAATSRAPLEPIHDLLTSETQLRNSPSGKGTSLVGLEKDMVGAPGPWRRQGCAGRPRKGAGAAREGAQSPCAVLRAGGRVRVAPVVHGIGLPGAERWGSLRQRPPPSQPGMPQGQRRLLLQGAGVKPVGFNYKRVAKWLDQKHKTVFRFCFAVSEWLGRICSAEGTNGSKLPGLRIWEGSVFSLTSLNIQILSEQSYILIY